MRRYVPAALIVIFYLLVKFVFAKQLDALGDYASYIFEALFVLAVSFYYRKRFKLKFKLSPLYLIQLPLALAGGFAVYKGAGLLNLPIPFDLKSHETILFLLLIGPLIEECVFRQALWWPLEDLLGKHVWVILATTVIFACGHFYAYFFVPPAIQAFVIYQTTYVILIGLWWGGLRWIKGSITATLPLHILFNLGFWLGFIVLG